MDRDKIHLERVDELISSQDENAALDDLFISDRVKETIWEEKIFLPSLNLDEIVALAPFSENIYVLICPVCATSIDFDKLKILIEKRVILPVLSARYDRYAEPQVDFIYTHDHLSVYEYNVFRQSQIISESNGKAVCPHCAGKRAKGVERLLNEDPS
jgi:hypothetical protein